MAIIEMNLRQFDDFAKNHPYKSFYQTSQYGSLMTKLGYKPLYLGYVENNAIKAASLILIKTQFGTFKTAYSPRGFLINFNDYALLEKYTKELKNYLAKKNVVSLTIDPHITYMKRDVSGKPIEGENSGVNIYESLLKMGYVHTGFNLYFENQKPRWNMILKTDKSTIDIFNSFSKETRTKIRNSLRKGVEVYKGTSADLKLFYQMIGKNDHNKFSYYAFLYNIFTKFNMCDIYFARINTETFLRNSKLLYEHEMQRNSKIAEELQKHFKNPEDKTRVLNKKIASDKLLNAFKYDMDFANRLFSQNKYIVVACNAIIKYEDEMFFLIDGINPKFKKFNANHLLKWKIIEECRNNNCKKFNLNGITGDFNNKNKYFGLYTFKKGFNADVTEYIGEFKYIINKPRYNLYNSLKPIMKLTKKDIA